MKTIEQIFFGNIEIPLASGRVRVEITESTIRIVNASKLVDGGWFLFNKIGGRKVEADEEFSELLSGYQFFNANGVSINADFSGLRFPKVEDMRAMFEGTAKSAGYPSEFPKAVNFSYPFRNSNLKKFLFDLPQATSLYCAADLCSNLELVDTNLPVCTSLYHAFAACAKLKTARLVAPRCTDYQTLFLEDKALESAEILNANSGSILSIVYINHVCTNCTSLLTFTMTDTSRVYSADEAFNNTPKLQAVPLSYPLLFTGKGMFKNSNLTVEQINSILESLPAYREGTHIITFTNCPGAATCSPEIATSKGWTVEI